MTQGKVIELQARINVVLRLSNLPDVVLEFVLDTGFEGALTLPPNAVAVLGLPFVQEMSANLADDSSIKTNIHAATIIWNGAEIDVAVLAMGKRPLLGTALLANKRLGVDFEENGTVTIGDIS